MSCQVRFLTGRLPALLTGAASFGVVLAAPLPAQAATGYNEPGRQESAGVAAATEPTLRDILAMVNADAPEGGGPDGGASRCEWRPGTMNRWLGTVPVGPGSPWPEAEVVDLQGVTSVLYGRICPDGGVTWMWIRQVPPQQLAAAGADMVRQKLPLPGGEFSPEVSAGRPAVVHLPLWFAVPAAQWAPVSATASIPGLAATVTARPVRLTFEPGDGGGPVSCAGPGPRYTPGMGEPAQPPACSYTYRDASTTATNGASWPARLSIQWQVSWTATSGAGGDLGPLTTTTAYPMTVGEIQAIESGNRR